jgi:hypothetical protein
MLLLPILLAAAAQPAPAEPVRMNDVQAIGTHNSYKQPMSEAARAAIAARSAQAVLALDYAHRPLAEQLDRGARQIELDVNHDPEGGYYADGSTDPALKAPGFKVLHMAGTDNASSCLRLVQCLSELRAWSDRHPGHVPILLMFNAKESANETSGKPALHFDEAAYDALDAEIRSVLPPEKLIVPDDVQSRYPTLREAVLANNWPTLEKARGKFLFALDEGPEKVAIYRGKRRSLEGRVFFINTDEDSPAAAYLTLNDPVAEGARIARDVKAGYLVRTRADADTWEARANTRVRLDAALRSGAQYISTDYLWAEPRLSPYEVALPGHAPARCNPVRAAGGCKDSALEARAN